MSDAHPTPARLLELSEGAELPAVAEHVAGCAPCRAQVAGAQQSLRALATASPLTRSFCPPRSELVEVAPNAGPLASHLAACPLCREDLRDLRALEAAPLPERLLGAVRARLHLALVAAEGAVRWLESTLTPTPILAVAVRGTSSAAPAWAVRLPFGDGELEVSAGGGDGVLHLTCRAVGRAPLPFRLDLELGGERLEAASSSPKGVVVFADLEPGDYVVRAYGPFVEEPAASAPLVELELRVTNA